MKNRQFLRFIHTNNNNYHNPLLQTGFVRVYFKNGCYITYNIITNFPEICAFIIGFSFTVWTKKSPKKYGNK